MTNLDRETLRTSYTRIQRMQFGQAKFVREGDIVVWDRTMLPHNTIAKNHGLNDPEDAGYIFASQLKDELIITDNSFTMQLPRNPDDRIKTGKVLEEITQMSGIDVKVSF